MCEVFSIFRFFGKSISILHKTTKNAPKKDTVGKLKIVCVYPLVAVMIKINTCKLCHKNLEKYISTQIRMFYYMEHQCNCVLEIVTWHRSVKKRKRQKTSKISAKWFDHVVKGETWACSTLQVGKNKPIYYVIKMRDFKRFCEEIKEKRRFSWTSVFGLSDRVTALRSVMPSACAPVFASQTPFCSRVPIKLLLFKMCRLGRMKSAIGQKPR